MDNPTKVLSGERDFIQVCQAEELNVNDWEIMTTRTTGRGAVMPYTQVFGDCNPAGSKHFIRARVSIRLLASRHIDNPSLYDDGGGLTEQGNRTMQTLEKLTGVRRKRLLEGIWATAEGAVYEGFDVNIHAKVQDRNKYSNFRLAMDEGYTNPAVIIVIGEDSDGRKHVFEEWYERGRLQSEVVAKAIELAGKYKTKRAFVDASAAGLIADLRNSGIIAVGTEKDVRKGIAKVQDALKVQPDGFPRLTIDPSCVNGINEFESYIWKPEKDEPVKENDHELDAIRYDFLAPPVRFAGAVR
jgi:phage terminase large subunit